MIIETPALNSLQNTLSYNTMPVITKLNIYNTALGAVPRSLGEVFD